MQKAIKLYPNLISTTTQILNNILEQKQAIDKCLKPALKNKQFGSRDRRFIAEQVYEFIRNKNQVEAKLAALQLPIDIPHAILIFFIQNDYIIRNPEVIGAYDEHQLTIFKEALADFHCDHQTKLSYSDFFWQTGIQDYGNNWLQIAESLNQPAKLILRTNLLVTSTEKLLATLRKEFELVDLKNDAFAIIGRANITNHKLFKQGHFEVQDYSSQQLALLATPQPNDLVIDVCAGAGGKALHFASLMQNKGRIVATDYNFHRTKQLELRMRRAKARNIQLVEFEQLDLYKDKADIVVLDVPCSGSGTIRRKPELKYFIDESMVKHYCTIQQNLLVTKSKLVKSGGKLVYATCSIFKSESETQVTNFLANNPDFKLKIEKRLLPNTIEGDGFYVAVMERV